MSALTLIAIFAVGIFVGALCEYLRTNRHPRRSITGRLVSIQSHRTFEGEQTVTFDLTHTSGSGFWTPMGPVCIHPISEEKS